MRRTILLIAATAGIARAAAAQATGFASLTAQAVAESLTVMKRLQDFVKANPRDDVAQSHLGWVAFLLSENARLKGQRSNDYFKLRDVASHAFYAAFDLAPTKVEHSIALGKFTIVGDVGQTVPRGYFRNAIKLAKNAADSAALVEAAMQLGGIYWRHSEFADVGTVNPTMEWTGERPPVATRVDPYRSNSQANVATTGGEVSSTRLIPRDVELPNGRLPAIEQNDVTGHLVSGMPTSVIGAAGRDSLGSFRQIMARATNRLHEKLLPVKRPEYFYLSGEKYTREAYEIDPGNPSVFRQLAAIMLGRERWAELSALGLEQTKNNPADAMGWMAMGLGLQQLRKTREARFAFDSGFARMQPAERARLDRIDRVLGARDSVKYAKLDSAEKMRFEKTWWLLNSPLWARSDVDPRTEFHARITYAELRWSWDGYPVSGADASKGRHLVRYGVPKQELGQFSLYDNGLVFSKCMRFGNCDNGDAKLIAEIRDNVPSYWDNIADMSIVEMPASISRFRTETDSIDVFVAARAPMDALRSQGIGNATARTWLWLNSWDSTTTVERKETTDALGYTSWRERITAGAYYARFESMVDGAKVAGRAVATVNLGADSLVGFKTRGFGISDLLIANTATGPANARRWRDLSIAPSLNGVRQGASVALVWETYELGNVANAADYDVTITIERERSALGRIVARIVNGFDGNINTRSSSNALTLQFERHVPYADAIVDNVVLSLGTTPPGEYTVRLSVQDKVSGRVMARTTPMVIVK